MKAATETGLVEKAGIVRRSLFKLRLSATHKQEQADECIMELLECLDRKDTYLRNIILLLGPLFRRTVQEGDHLSLEIAVSAYHQIQAGLKQIESEMRDAMLKQSAQTEKGK